MVNGKLLFKINNQGSADDSIIRTAFFGMLGRKKLVTD